MAASLKSPRKNTAAAKDPALGAEQATAPIVAPEPAASQPTGLRGRATATAFSQKEPRLMSSLEHFQEAQLHRQEAERIGYRNGKRRWNLDEQGNPVTAKDAEVQAAWKHHTRMGTAHMQMGVAKDPSHHQHEEARQNGAFESGAAQLGFTWRDPLTMATGASPKDMLKTILKDPRFEGSELREEARFHLNLAKRSSTDAWPDTDPAYYGVLEQALRSELVKGTELEDQFRLTLDAWTAAIPKDQRTQKIQAKGVLFPYATRLEDLFGSVEPHTRSIPHGPNNVFSSFMSVRGKGGAHAPALSAILKPAAADAIAPLMFVAEQPESICFGASRWSDTHTLILAHYQHMLGDRWLAMVATDSVPDLADQTGKE